MKKLVLILTILLFFTRLNLAESKDLDLYLIEDSYQEHYFAQAYVASFKTSSLPDLAVLKDQVDYQFHSMYFKLFDSYDSKEIVDYKIDEYDVEVQSKVKSLLVDDEVLLDDNLKGNSHYDVEADIIFNVNRYFAPYVTYRLADIAFDAAAETTMIDGSDIGVSGVGTKFSVNDNFSLDISYGQDNLHLIESGADDVIQDHHFRLETIYNF